MEKKLVLIFVCSPKQATHKTAFELFKASDLYEARDDEDYGVMFNHKNNRYEVYLILPK